MVVVQSQQCLTGVSSINCLACHPSVFCHRPLPRFHGSLPLPEVLWGSSRHISTLITLILPPLSFSVQLSGLPPSPNFVKLIVPERSPTFDAPWTGPLLHHSSLSNWLPELPSVILQLGCCIVEFELPCCDPHCWWFFRVGLKEISCPDFRSASLTPWFPAYPSKFPLIILQVGL